MKEGSVRYGLIMAAGWRERARDHTACTRVPASRTCMDPSDRSIELTSKCLPSGVADQIGVGDGRRWSTGHGHVRLKSAVSQRPPETETRAVHVDPSAIIMAIDGEGSALSAAASLLALLLRARARDRAGDPSHT